MLDNEMIMPSEIELSAKILVSQMTLDEKVELMTGNSNLDLIRETWRLTHNFSYYPYTSFGCLRLGIPPLKFTDGTRGIVCGTKRTTCFPSTICRGASFDSKLEYKIGVAMAKESRMFGANMFGGICVNVPYHPGWGRNQEVYGEDEFTIGKLAGELVKGVQSKGIIACIKHFAFNTSENNRFYVDYACEKRTEKEIYLAPFKDCIDAGADCIMAAFNKYNHDYCCQSSYLISDILRDEWDFQGIVISDWFSGIKDTVLSVNAGLDMEMPIGTYYGSKIIKFVKESIIDETVIDQACMRIVKTFMKYKETSIDNPIGLNSDIELKMHQNLALESAKEGITLLKNERNILPLDIRRTKTVLVIGKLSVSDNLGDHGSSRVFPSRSVSPLAGISKMLPNAEIIFYNGENIEHAKSIALTVDAVLFFVGNDFSNEGEFMTSATSPDYRRSIGGDRESIQLNKQESELIQQVGPLNRNSIVILFGGGAIVMHPWIHHVSSVIIAYYPGQEGGTAIAEILFGKHSPSGKLPFTIPFDENDLPKINWSAQSQFLDYFHGYTYFDKKNITPHFYFGFGLSYTTFCITDQVFSLEDQMICAGCTVINTGRRKGAEVIQLYVGFQNSKVKRAIKQLKGFERIELTPNESATIKICCPLEKIKYFDDDTDQFVLEAMMYEVYLGTSSNPEDLFRGDLFIDKKVIIK